MAYTYSKISTVTVGSGGSSSIDFIAIPQNYTDLIVKMSIKATPSGNRSDFYWVINNDTSSRYSYRRIIGYDNTLTAAGSANGTAATSGGTPAANQSTAYTAASPANTFGSVEICFPNYTSTNIKSHTADWAAEANSATDWIVGLSAYVYSGNNPISSLSFVPGSGNFAQYSKVTLYGVKAEV